jgi:xanthine dehydrogenase accessory factor
MKRELLAKLIADRDAKRSVALVTNLANGDQVQAYPTGAVPGLPAQLVPNVRQAIQDNESQTVEIEGAGRWFVEVLNPPLRLILVGAVHIAQPLAQMAAVAGYDVSIVDPRASFATDARFPGVKLVDEWPDDALKQLDPDRRTAVVTLTHDPKLDDPALAVALRSDAFYIGSLGSRRTH